MVGGAAVILRRLLIITAVIAWESLMITLSFGELPGLGTDVEYLRFGIKYVMVELLPVVALWRCK